MNPFTLYHYTTPKRAADILLTRLEPRSELPGTDELVNYAFLGQAPYEWSGGMRDYMPPCDLLSMILNASVREGRAGIVELTFEASDARVFDRSRGHSVEDYLDSEITLREYVNNPRGLDMRMPEAVVGPIEPNRITVGRTWREDEARSFIKDYFYL